MFSAARFKSNILELWDYVYWQYNMPQQYVKLDGLNLTVGSVWCIQCVRTVQHVLLCCLCTTTHWIGDEAVTKRFHFVLTLTVLTLQSNCRAQKEIGLLMKTVVIFEIWCKNSLPDRRQQALGIFPVDSLSCTFTSQQNGRRE